MERKVAKKPVQCGECQSFLDIVQRHSNYRFKTIDAVLKDIQERLEQLEGEVVVVGSVVSAAVRNICKQKNKSIDRQRTVKYTGLVFNHLPLFHLRYNKELQRIVKVKTAVGEIAPPPPPSPPKTPPSPKMAPPTKRCRMCADKWAAQEDRQFTRELISDGTIFEVDPLEANGNFDDPTEEDVTNEEYDEELVKHVNANCIGEFEDEEIYDSSEPFSFLKTKMEDLFGNGSIMKKVLRQGYGNKPEEKSVVKVHYNAYTELEATPFDCTYARKKPHIFILGIGEVIPGLDLAVQSMLLNEKSQFLIKPELAYGKFGCLGRIPPDATVLFQIELLEIIESGAAENFHNLPEKKQQEFPEIYNFCVAQSERGKNLFNRDSIPAAIKQYNIAVSKLELVQLADYGEQKKQQELLQKLYQNLLVCHTKIQEPKKGCINFNKLNHLSKGSDLKITAKIYYNHAKCLRMLGEYNRAKESLQKARSIEPRNPYVLKEFKIIDEEQKKYKENEKKLAAAMIKPKDEAKQ